MKYDVTIVGGGPAGSTAAKFLSEKGIKTLIIDKSKFPRDKPCGGGIPIRLLDRYNYLKNTDLIECLSFGGIAYSPSLKYKLEYIDNSPIAVMILRQKFDNGLLNFAKNSGTVVYDGKNVKDIKISEDIARVILNDGNKIDSEIIIGADGVWSTVAKKTGLHNYKRWIAVCVFKEYKLDEATVDKYYGNNRCGHLFARFNNISGYGWIFPKKEHLNIGIGSIIKRGIHPNINVNLLNFYKKFLDSIKKHNMVPPDLKIDNVKGGALPNYPLKKTYSNRVVLIGDAAGLINPITGEGIYYAMRSGEIAANVISNALESENTSESFLCNYQKVWKKDFGEDIDLLIGSINVNKEQSIENYFNIASKDKKLTELLIKILTGQASIKKNKWKIARRIIFGSVKSRFLRK